MHFIAEFDLQLLLENIGGIAAIVNVLGYWYWYCYLLRHNIRKP